MDSPASGKLGYAYFRASLDFLQYPHLRARKSAAIFDFAEVLAHASVNDAELLQDVHGELGWMCRGGAHGIGGWLRKWRMSIILLANVV